jgi:hypothetical protein
MVSLSRDGLKIKVEVKGRELEIDPIEIVVHNREKLFGEPDLNYEIIKGSDGSTTHDYVFHSGEYKITKVEQDHEGNWQISKDQTNPVKTPAIRYELSIRGNRKVEIVFPSNIPENTRLKILNELNGFYQSVGDSWTQATHKVVFDPKNSPDDAYWQKEYNNPFHRGAASGGNGTITFYNGIKHFDSGTFWHEFGHNYAKEVWKGTEPPEHHADRQRWEAAYKEEASSISSYAEVHLQEYVAEAIRVFAQKRAEGNGTWQRWREKHPLTIELLDPLFRVISRT